MYKRREGARGGKRDINAQQKKKRQEKGGGTARTIDGGAQHFLSKLWVIRNNGCCQVVLHSLAHFKDEVELRIVVLCYDLERSKEFVRHDFKVFWLAGFFNRDEDGGGFVRAVAVWDRMLLLKRLASKEKLAARDLQDGFLVRRNVCVAPRKHRGVGKV